MVSMNVWVMDTRPWRTGCVVCAAAAAMAAEPMPDSLEKMPRATPYCTASMKLPKAPPAMPGPVNAWPKISASAPGTSTMLTMRM